MTNHPLALWLALAHTSGLHRRVVRLAMTWAGVPPGAHTEGDCAPWLARLSRAPWGRALQEVLRLSDASVRVEQVARWMGQDPAHMVLTPGHPQWPVWLAASPDPPVLLYAHGALALLDRPALAIVGTRRPTGQGREIASRLARCAAAHGWCVVSGLASGIDACAHLAALAEPGRSIAVLGTGIDQCYPAHHAQLARQLATEGLLLSEYPLGTHAAKHHFPCRNRIVAGLASSTLVIEAAARSGSLLTAQMAVDMGRDVLAVPGSIYSEHSQGCHGLIQQGAGLIDGEEALLSALNGSPATAPAQPERLPALRNLPAPSPPLPDGSLSSPTSRRAARPTRRQAGSRLQASRSALIHSCQAGSPHDGEHSLSSEQASPRDTAELDALDRLGWDPFSLERAQRCLEMDTGSTSQRLLDEELAGRLSRLPGGRWQRIR